MSKNYIIIPTFILFRETYLSIFISPSFLHKKLKIFCIKIYQSIFNTLPAYKERQTLQSARVYCSDNITTNNYTNTYTIG